MFERFVQADPLLPSGSLSSFIPEACPRILNQVDLRQNVGSFQMMLPEVIRWSPAIFELYGIPYEDHEGVDLGSVAAAMDHAADDARAVIRDQPEVPREFQWIEIVDERGNTIQTLPFEAVA